MSGPLPRYPAFALEYLRIQHIIKGFPFLSSVRFFHSDEYRGNDGSLVFHWDYNHHLTLHLVWRGRQLIVRQTLLTTDKKNHPTDLPFTYGSERKIPFDKDGIALLEWEDGHLLWCQASGLSTEDIPVRWIGALTT